MIKHIVVVTVTYGKRWHLLTKVIDAVRSQGIEKIIVVDNGSLEKVKELCKAQYEDTVEVIRSEVNTGSAGGFYIGLDRALKLVDCEYIFLLDDDNVVDRNCISELILCYRKHSGSGLTKKLAILAFRVLKQGNLIKEGGLLGINGRRGGFFGFHVLDIPAKLYKRFRAIPATKGTAFTKSRC